MAGPQDIQRFPQGLIDLLGMRATGDTPHQLAQQTIPTLDLTKNYVSDRMIGFYQQTGVAPTVVGFLVGSIGVPTVPFGQLWYVGDATLVLPPPAVATAISGFIAVERANITASLNYTALTPQANATALLGAAASAQYENFVLLRPGDRIGFYTTAITGVPAVQPQIYLTLARLGI